MSPCAHSSFDHSPFDLTIDAEWDNMCDVPMQEAELPAKEEVCNVLKEWTSDEESHMDIVGVDEQIGSDFLGYELFESRCTSPVSPEEELASLQHFCSDETTTNDMKGVDCFLTLNPPTSAATSSASAGPVGEDLVPLATSLASDEKYRDAFKKLMESMKRSQETRVSLSMESPKAGKTYGRRKSVKAVLCSIEKSRQKLQSCFGSTMDE